MATKATKPVSHETESTVSSQSVQTTQKKPSSVLITSSFKPEDVINFDAEGKELFFEQKEQFLLIPDDMVAQLSRENKMRYHAAKQFYEAWKRQELEELSSMLTVEPEYVGSAWDKLNKMEVAKGYHVRWVRRDRVAAMMAKGYKRLGANEATTLLGAQGDSHVISQNGKAELVLMGIPNDVYRQHQQERTQQNNKLANAWATSGVADLNKQGAQGFVARDGEDAGQWQDL